MTRTFSPPPDYREQQPALRLPVGAWDTHVHVIGPQTMFPLHPDRLIDIEDATVEKLQQMHKRLGFSYMLLVQSGMHFYSYRHLLHLLCRFPGWMKGVAILDDDVTERELDLLGDAGVVGARFYPGLNTPNARQLDRIHSRGWSAHVLFRDEVQALAWQPALQKSSGAIVIEHAGWQDPAAGLEGKGFGVILNLLESGRCWVKLSPRMSKHDVLPFRDCMPFMQRLVAVRPDRILWGSDWPHPNYFKPMPNDADLLDLMLDWVPDETVRKEIFVRNPARLFGLPTGARPDGM